jgi:hypothetical protein
VTPLCSCVWGAWGQGSGVRVWGSGVGFWIWDGVWGWQACVKVSGDGVEESWFCAVMCVCVCVCVCARARADYNRERHFLAFKRELEIAKRARELEEWEPAPDRSAVGVGRLGGLLAAPGEDRARAPRQDQGAVVLQEALSLEEARMVLTQKNDDPKIEEGHNHVADREGGPHPSRVQEAAATAAAAAAAAGERGGMQDRSCSMQDPASGEITRNRLMGWVAYQVLSSLKNPYTLNSNSSLNPNP